MPRDLLAELTQTEQPQQAEMQQQPQGRDLFADSVAPVEEKPRRTMVDRVNEKMPKGTAIDAVVEPTKAIIGGMGGQVASGLAGIGMTALSGPEEGTKTIEGIQQYTAEKVAPKTQAGKKSLETIQDLIEAGVDVVNYPLSGIAGLVELVSGQGTEQAAETIKSIQEEGLSKTVGKRIYEETGSPLLAATAETAPTAIMSAVPIARMVKKRTALKAKLADDIRAASAQPAVGREISTVSQGIRSGSLTPEQGAQQLMAISAKNAPNIGTSTSKRIAGLADDLSTGKQGVADSLDDIADTVSKAQPDKALSTYIAKGYDKVKADPVAKEAIKQGFDDGVVAAIKGSTPQDRANMAKMLQKMKEIQKNPMTDGRPADVAGSSLLNRVNYIKKINSDAGKKLDKVAKSLKGKDVDFSQPVDNFIDNLDDMGVTIGRDMKLSFKGSDIEGLTGIEGTLKKVVGRMASGQKPSAYDLHRMKKFIDENVTYGKQAEGLTGRTERVLKQLRADINKTLQDNFPDYKEVNTTYADTINALDSIQDVAGRKMDLFGPNSDKAVGTLLRRLMSNAQSRVNLTDAVDDVQRVATKYGGTFDDNIKAQMLFADELDDVFGPVARSSLAGETAKGFRKGAEAATGRRGPVDLALDIGEAGIEKARGINKENAIKAMEELLKRE